MQKKLLLLCAAINFVTIQAILFDLDQLDKTPINNEKNYTEYTEIQREVYQKALVDDLAGNEKALDAADQKNKQANDDEEKESRKQQYDGNPGFWATEPSINSEIGRKYHEYAQHKEAKNKVNQNFSKEMREKKELFNKEILLDLVHHLDADRFFLMNNCLSALQDCGSDLNCYDEKFLSPIIFSDSHFGSKYEKRLYASGAKMASQKGIILTPEEIKIIVAGNPKTKEFVQGIQSGLDEISKVRNDILNTKNK
jgi:hypothetical protein